jgi:membrane protein DedA with SNARE-associated domain/rhodanese-related sulfurtransferase
MPALEFFLHYRYLILFAWVLGEQMGMPVPAVPLLVTVGTLAVAHRVNVWLCLPPVVLAAMLGDSIWFTLGRRYGNRVLQLLCRLSLEAESCVHKTAGYFEKHGGSTLLIAKFVPGLSTVATPIAGEMGMPVARFLALDLAGILLWAGAAMGAGYFFGDILRKNQKLLTMAGHDALWLFILSVAGFLAFRIFQQQGFRRYVRENRIEPLEVMQMLDAGAAPFIVDLRHPKDYLPDPRVLPGAVRVGPADLTAHNHVLPRDREVILYCTCPSEETSARVTMQLRKLGIARVRPLHGGFDAWKQAGYPLEEYLPAAKPQVIAMISR